MSDDHTPILIGAGQLTQRDVEPADALGPLEMMVETAQRAAADAGAGRTLLQAIDSVAVVNIFAWHYSNVARILSERIGARPAEEIYTTVGGNTPQWLVNETAAKIVTGRVRLALLAGAETIYSLVRARRSSGQPSWISGGEGQPTIVGDGRPGTNERESALGLQLPVQIYPLFENALRAHSGRSLAAHGERLGELCSRLSAVAAENPYAWFPRARTATEIATPSRENRMIGFPYTKYMNAVLDVDQSAAVLMTSVAGARSLGVPEDRWIYLWGSGDGMDRWFLSERQDYHSSPAIRALGGRALAAADLTLDRVTHFDLYSCFPAAVQIARDMLGLADDDPRPLTVTGGLPYAGGPGSNYTMHAIAAMMTKLRSAPSAVGLVTALGWYVTKHSIGIYSAEPPARPWRRTETYDDTTEGSDGAPVVVDEANGQGTIETYTVMHDRDGQPMWGFVVGRLGDDRRFLATMPEDRDVLETLTAKEAVGRSGRVRVTGNGNRFDPA